MILNNKFDIYLTNTFKKEMSSIIYYLKNTLDEKVIADRFYNNIINDKRLLDVLKKKGYKAKFCIHPSFEKQVIDFKPNKYITVSKNLPDYQKEFKQNALLITDYSSVAFDFAYLKKPVIYTQFDRSTFLRVIHIVRGILIMKIMDLVKFAMIMKQV